MADVVEMRAIIRGQVQGVGFRVTTHKHASRLNLKGTVRNLPDGSVEIFVQGSQCSIDQLIAQLKEREYRGYIENVDFYVVAPLNHYDGFLILRSSSL
jgi:acylphosphatase